MPQHHPPRVTTKSPRPFSGKQTFARGGETASRRERYRTSALPRPERGGQRGNHAVPRLRSLVPRGQVLRLFLRERVDLDAHRLQLEAGDLLVDLLRHGIDLSRSEEHTSELQSRENLVCRPLLEKKKLRESTGSGCRYIAGCGRVFAVGWGG